MVSYIHKVQRNHACGNALLSVSTDASEMMCVTQRHQNQSGFTALFNSFFHCYLTNRLTVATFTIKHHNGTVTLEKFRNLIGLEQISLEHA